MLSKNYLDHPSRDQFEKQNEWLKINQKVSPKVLREKLLSTKQKREHEVLKAKENAGISTDINIVISWSQLYLESHKRLTEIKDTNELGKAYSLWKLSNPTETILLANMSNFLINKYKNDKKFGSFSWEKIEGKFEFDYPSSIDFDEDNLLSDIANSIAGNNTEKSINFDPDYKAVSEDAISKFFPTLYYNKEKIEAYCDYLNQLL